MGGWVIISRASERERKRALDLVDEKPGDLPPVAPVGALQAHQVRALANHVATAATTLARVGEDVLVEETPRIHLRSKHTIIIDDSMNCGN